MTAGSLSRSSDNCLLVIPFSASTTFRQLIRLRSNPQLYLATNIQKKMSYNRQRPQKPIIPGHPLGIARQTSPPPLALKGQKQPSYSFASALAWRISLPHSNSGRCPELTDSCPPRSIGHLVIADNRHTSHSNIVVLFSHLYIFAINSCRCACCRGVGEFSPYTNLHQRTSDNAR